MATEGPGGADWDDIYVGDGSDTEPFDRQLLSDALDLPPGRAVDLGCGAGGNAIGLAQRGWEITGVDLAPKAIRSARITADAVHVLARFLVADITTWRPDGLYDLVVSSYALPPRGAARNALLATAVEALAPGGLLIVGEWDAEGATGGNPDLFVALAELTAALADLEIIRAESVIAESHDLADHQPGPGGGCGREESRSWRAVVVVAHRSPKG